MSRAPRIAGFYDYYLRALGREGSAEIDEEICEMLAVPPSVVQELMTRQEAASKKEDASVEDLLKTLLEGAG